MNVNRQIGDFLVDPRPKALWKVLRLLFPAATTAEILLAAAILDLGEPTLIKIVPAAATWLDATTAQQAKILAATAISNHGGQSIMALIERLLQPLLKAQHQKGIEEGIQEGIQKSIDQGTDQGFKRGKQRSDEVYQEWIRRQIEAGAQLRDDIPPPQP